MTDSPIRLAEEYRMLHAGIRLKSFEIYAAMLYNEK